MKYPHLRLVASNANHVPVPDVPADDAEARAEARALMLARLRIALGVLVAIGLAPFRAVRFLARLFVSTGLGLFSAIYKLFLGSIGLALIFVVLYGMSRFLLHPFLH